MKNHNAQTKHDCVVTAGWGLPGIKKSMTKKRAKKLGIKLKIVKLKKVKVKARDLMGLPRLQKGDK